MNYSTEQILTILEKVEDLTNPFSQNENKNIKRLTVLEALKEVGVKPTTYRKWLINPLYQGHLNEIQGFKFYQANHEAESVIMDGINGNKVIPELDRIKLSERVLKNTSRRHNVGITQITESNEKINMKPSDILDKLESKLLSLLPKKT